MAKKRRRPSLARRLARRLLLFVVFFALLVAGSHWLPPSPLTRPFQQLDQQGRKLLEEGFRSATERRSGGTKGSISIRKHPAHGEGPQPEESVPRASKPDFSQQDTSPVPGAVARRTAGIVPILATTESEIVPGGISAREETAGIGTVVWRSAHSVLVLTAAHVVRTGQPQVGGGRGRPPVPVDLVASDPTADLALLRASARALPSSHTLALEARTDAREGATLWFLTTAASGRASVLVKNGVILGQPEDVRTSVTARYGEDRASLDWFVLSRPSLPGESGAPALSRAGKLAGVVLGGIRYADGTEALARHGAGGNRLLPPSIGASRLREIAGASVFNGSGCRPRRPRWSSAEARLPGASRGGSVGGRSGRRCPSRSA